MIVEVKNKVNAQISEDDVNREIIGAYYIEIFRRQDRNKRLPPLKNFLVDSKKKKVSVEENSVDILEKVKVLNTLFGGELIVN